MLVSVAAMNTGCDSTRIDAADLRKLRPGMSLDEVNATLGREGHLLRCGDNVELRFIPSCRPDERNYRWPNKDGSVADGKFRNGKLATYGWAAP